MLSALDIASNPPKRGSCWAIGQDRCEVEVLDSGHGKVVARRINMPGPGQYPIAWTNREWALFNPTRILDAHHD